MSVMTLKDFTANCLQVIENVDATGEPVFITKDGVPIVTLYSAQKKPQNLFGVMKGLFIEENVELLSKPVLQPEDLVDPVRET